MRSLLSGFVSALWACVPIVALVVVASSYQVSDNNSVEYARIAVQQSDRAARAEVEIDRMSHMLVNMRHKLNQRSIEVYGLHQQAAVIGQHLAQCHKLMQCEGIPIPSMDNLMDQDPFEPELELFGPGGSQE